MTWLGGRMPASAKGNGHLRASDADREQVIDTLKDAFAHGRLTKDEFDMRAGQALASRIYAQLTAVIADIPAGPFQAPPPPQTVQVRTRKPLNKKVIAWSAAAIILPPALGAAFLTFYGGFIVLFVFAFLGATATAQPRSP